MCGKGGRVVRMAPSCTEEKEREGERRDVQVCAGRDKGRKGTVGEKGRVEEETSKLVQAERRSFPCRQGKER